MTKVYLVKSHRVLTKENSKNVIVVENVFTNEKKAQNFIKWLIKNDNKNIKPFKVIKYTIDTWYIDKNDYSKLPY